MMKIIYYGNINCQPSTSLQNVIGGQFSSNLSNKITFFYSARRIE